MASSIAFIRQQSLSGIGFLVQSSSRPRSCSRATLLRAFAFPLMQGRGRWQLAFEL